jgi:hypothetical protein
MAKGYLPRNLSHGTADSLGELWDERNFFFVVTLETEQSSASDFFLNDRSQ